MVVADVFRQQPSQMPLIEHDARAKPTGLGQKSGDGAYDHGLNAAGSRVDGGEQESLLAVQSELGNNLGERKVESAWPGKAIGCGSVNAAISMCTEFLVGTSLI
jgi:hypothetical protein